MESRCLITHVWLCWEHPAHLSSNELHETDCFFILHLTLQQKCLNKTVPPLMGYVYPSEAPEEQAASVRSLKAAEWFSWGNVLALLWSGCLCASVCFYHTVFDLLAALIVNIDVYVIAKKCNSYRCPNQQQWNSSSLMRFCYTAKHKLQRVIPSINGKSITNPRRCPKITNQ